MDPALRATVIVPTSIDRGPLLRYSVGSVLQQTVEDLEVFIIGDGAHDVTRDAARDLERADSRVRYFHHPKGPRRGEDYRHQALQPARGRIVTYLCDRDLYFPDHLEEMGRLLNDADFAHTYFFRIWPQAWSVEQEYDLSDPLEVAAMMRARQGLPLSFFGHRLDAYHRAGRPWTRTPPGHYTDQFFCRQFLSAPGVTARSGRLPTVLSFRRGAHPGLSTEQRRVELAAWSDRIQQPAERIAIRDQVGALVHRDREIKSRVLRRPVVVCGAALSWRTPVLVAKTLFYGVVDFAARRPESRVVETLRRWWSRRKASRPPSTTAGPQGAEV